MSYFIFKSQQKYISFLVDTFIYSYDSEYGILSYLKDDYIIMIFN